MQKFLLMMWLIFPGAPDVTTETDMRAQPFESLDACLVALKWWREEKGGNGVCKPLPVPAAPAPVRPSRERFT